MKKITLSILLVFGLIEVKSQEKSIQLISGNINTSQNFNGQIEVNSSDVFNGYHYKIIQFNSIPNKSELNSIRQTGILLLDYIPNMAYIAAIPSQLKGEAFLPLSIRTIIPVPMAAKQSKALQNKEIPQHAIDRGNQVHLSILLYSNVNLELAKQSLIVNGAQVEKQIDTAPILEISTSIEKLDQITALPFINFSEFIAPPSVPDDLRGRSLHRSNAINVLEGAGRKYDGSGLTMAVADDGEVGPHIDFKGRLIQLATPSSGSHGDMVSGIAAGAGNINPSIAGMATGARLVAYDIGGYTQIIDAVQNYANYNVIVTSTSFSQGCNTYTNDTKFIDDQLKNNRQLTHSFSAGNNAVANCNYGGGAGVTGWGNITGGYKLGKNVLAVANVSALDVRDNSSSRGPAPDGRIKPDIAANGLGQLSTNSNNTYQTGGGTSAASPGIGGISTQLNHAYKLNNNGVLPDATLIKTILLNTADEIGNEGPDFSFGFGRVNALNAAKAIEQANYSKDSLIQGDSNSFQITVPANATKLKVLIHWRDPGGNPSAVKALVNDLNLRLTNQTTGAVTLPWILDPTPNAVNLNTAATRGNDNLNNVEQVTISNPAAGNYIAKVYGVTIPFGQQDYYITYQIEKDEITLTYPMGGEGLRATESEYIRWDAGSSVGNFTLAYSTNNGSTYTNINTAIPGTARQFQWTVPSVTSGNVVLKISRGLNSDSTKSKIAIINVPTGLAVTKACPDSLTITWAAVAGAAKYEVSKLGAKYMDSVATVTGTTATIYAPSTDTTWYSVRAVTNTGAKGRRALALSKLPGLLNCVQAVDLNLSAIVYPKDGSTYYACDSIDTKKIVLKIKNLGINAVSGYSVNYVLDNMPINSSSVSSILNTNDSLLFISSNAIGNLTNGSHTLVAYVNLAGDLLKANDTIRITFDFSSGAAVFPYSETFINTAFPSNIKTIKSITASPGWTITNVVQSNGVSGRSARFANFTFSTGIGLEDEMILPLVQLPAAPASLMFDRAYKKYPGYFDSLFIYIADDCGKNFNQKIYTKGNRQLITITDTSTSAFTPNAASQWDRDTINLSAYANKFVAINFVNKSGYGNNLYIDNINIISNSALQLNNIKTSHLNIYPNPSHDVFNIDVDNGENVTFKLFNISGQLMQQGQFNGKISIDLKQYTNGIYHLQLNDKNGISNSKLVKY